MVELGGVGEDRRMLFPRKQHGYWVRGATDRQWRGHFITASAYGQKSDGGIKQKKKTEGKRAHGHGQQCGDCRGRGHTGGNGNGKNTTFFLKKEIEWER